MYWLDSQTKDNVSHEQNFSSKVKAYLLVACQRVELGDLCPHVTDKRMMLCMYER